MVIVFEPDFKCQSGIRMTFVLKKLVLLVINLSLTCSFPTNTLKGAFESPLSSDAATSMPAAPFLVSLGLNQIQAVHC